MAEGGTVLALTTCLRARVRCDGMSRREWWPGLAWCGVGRKMARLGGVGKGEPGWEGVYIVADRVGSVPLGRIDIYLLM